MAKTAGKARFTLETGDQFGFFDVQRREEFDGNIPLNHGIVGVINNTHCSFAKDGKDLIFIDLVG
jgi:hypothetical protein